MSARLVEPLTRSSTTRGETLLRVQDLSKKYRRNFVLKNLTFALRAGECTGLIGPNGAGKTTFMNIICGLTNPTSGRVRYASLLRNPIARGRQIGLLLDPIGLPAELTVRGYLLYECQKRGMPELVVDKTIDFFNMSSFRRRRIGSLSTGQKRRMGLANAALTNPEFLILDEPTNGLDVESMRWLRRYIDKRTEVGLTTLVSSHNLIELTKIATQAIVIKKTLRFSGPYEDLIRGSEDDIEAVYLDLVGDRERSDS